VAINSGANMNFDRLRFVAERAEVGEQREAVFAVTIPEERGSFRRFCATLGQRSITEFNYRIGDTRCAHIFVGVQIAERDDRDALLAAIREHGFGVLDLTDDELAKLHLRHMIGGRSALAHDELLYRFDFPERPGALTRFLDRMHPHWNISLFHYRNHGADYGRILVGLQVPGDERPMFRQFLGALGYPYGDESENPAYRLLFAGVDTSPCSPSESGARRMEFKAPRFEFGARHTEFRAPRVELRARRWEFSARRFESGAQRPEFGARRLKFGATRTVS
jgi:Threonine dehydratase